MLILYSASAKLIDISTIIRKADPKWSYRSLRIKRERTQQELCQNVFSDAIKYKEIRNNKDIP